MLKFLTGAAILAAIALVAASASMNFSFASSMGKTPSESLILGAVAIGVDVLKAVLAVLLGYAARERRWMFLMVGSSAFILFAALSLAAAFGFSASNRDAVLGERDRGNHRLADLESQIGDLGTKLKALPPHRLLALVDEALAASRIDARWSVSRQCVVTTTTRVREFCNAVVQLRSEHIASLEAARLERLIAVTKAEVEQLRQAGSGIVADSQARSIAQALGLAEAQVQRSLSALLALVVEVGSALGVYIAVGHRLRPQTAHAKTAGEALAIETPIPPAEPVHRPVSEVAEALPVTPPSVELAITKAPDECRSMTEKPMIDGMPRPGIAVGVHLTPRRASRSSQTRRVQNGKDGTES